MLDRNPLCFGNLDEVFPMGPDGLRHSPERCLACDVKTACLKNAIAGKNQHIVAGERLDRRYQSGNLSFLQRWSQKKMLSRRMQSEN